MGCIIVGASHAGVQAAVGLRSRGYKGAITLLSDEAMIPYQRPPLSKSFLQGALPKARLWLRPEAFYAQKNINLKLSCRVVSIDKTAKRVALDSGNTLEYETLILATGASVRRMKVPGSELPGIHSLRSYSDASKIQKTPPQTQKFVVVGGGYIGLEAAASLKKLGKEVTVLICGERPLQKNTSPFVSDHLSRLHAEHGVTLETKTRVVAFEGRRHVESVVCEDGRRFNADSVIVGIGVTPNQSLAEQCGLRTNNGIEVDAYMRTSDPSILAIGDCARFYHPIYERFERIESIQNATDQAKTAVSTVCGELSPHHCVPWFWSDQYDLKLQMAGLCKGYDSCVVRRSDDQPHSLSVFYFRKHRLIAVDAINQPGAYALARKHLAGLPAIDKTRLANPEYPLAELF